MTVVSKEVMAYACIHLTSFDLNYRKYIVQQVYYSHSFLKADLSHRSFSTSSALWVLAKQPSITFYRKVVLKM